MPLRSLADLPAVRVVLDLAEEPALTRTWTWRELHETPESVPAWVFRRPPWWLREPEIVWHDPRLPVEIRGLVPVGMEDVAREWLWPDR